MDRSQTISHALKLFAYFISHIELKTVADAGFGVVVVVVVVGGGGGAAAAMLAFHLDCLHIMWLCVCRILHDVQTHTLLVLCPLAIK